ncbi:M10 family metallopeptidase C-terminal domain-containing protein [Methylopila musalis]|uniref:M10 family metallopeptidase C-terminal domain-containing protein n=1 Tax=Methylopila musalis TaxID=1134781 RepID=A0ABW3Z6L9_9HYPH
MAEVGKSGDASIDGVLWGYRVDGTNITYGFPDAVADYASYKAIDGFQAFNAAQQTAVHYIMNQVASVSGLTVQFVEDGGSADFRFGMATSINYGGMDDRAHRPGGSNDSAEANPPDPSRYNGYQQGDSWYNTSNYNAPTIGSFGFAAGIAHEVGHNFGLKHGHAELKSHGVTFPELPAGENGQEWSIMTYRASPLTGDVRSTYELPQSLMMNDIATLQYMYGADYGTNSGNTTYSFSATTGEMFVDGVGQGAPNTNAIFRTIWDGGGVDTYDFSNYTTGTVVDLGAGRWSTPADGQRAYLGQYKDASGTTVNYFAQGSIANAKLFNNDTRSLIENATGGSGADRITGNQVANRLVGNGGFDILYGLGGDDQLDGGDAGDWLFGGDGNDTLVGGAGGDTLYGESGNDVLRGGEGGDSMYGGVGDDTYYIDGSDFISENLGAGYDTVVSSVNWTLAANFEVLRLSGLAFRGSAGAGSQSLYGNFLANRLDGGEGADYMAGGAGGDTYVVDNVYDVVSEGEDQGVDTVEAYVDYVLSAHVENLKLMGGARAGFGNTLANTLTGSTGADLLNGGGGYDTLIGGAGDDTYELFSQSGRPTAAGFFIMSYDAVQEDVNGGYDTVHVQRTSDMFGTGYTLSANVEAGVVVGEGDFALSGNELSNRLTGNVAANTLSGQAGADRLDGGLGVDDLIGGAGDDTYILADYNLVSTRIGQFTYRFWRYDSVTEDVDGGTDTVRIRAAGSQLSGYTLGANVENGVIEGADDFNLTGNALANQLTGNAASNTLIGGEGDDLLNGGLGVDTLQGGLGDDVYVLSDYRTFLFNGFTSVSHDSVSEEADAGVDTVRVALPNAAGYTLRANFENGELTGAGSGNLAGNALDNRLTGNVAANTLSGGDGADWLFGGLGLDTLIGGAGDDVYVLADTTLIPGPKGRPIAVFDTVDETSRGSGGTDTVVIGSPVKGSPNAIAATSYVLGSEIENGQIGLSTAFDLTGNALANRLTGGSGANVLDGGAGADTLIGGRGNDSYVVDDADDVVVEAAGQGADTVRASVNHTLAANVEALVLLGAAVNGSGNALANTLTGNALANRLDGKAGADTLIGGAGNDSYVVDDAGDVIVEAAGGGVDRVEAWADVTLSANVENLRMMGTAALKAVGNEAKNIIVGNEAGNVLDGGGGADDLRGFGGNDTYVIDHIGDRVTEAAGGGVDRVEAWADVTLSANVENLRMMGTAALKAVGNEAKNIIIGNEAGNVLDGGGGADDLRGFGGNDRYVVDHAQDRVTEAADGGLDVVDSSVSYTLSAHVETLRLRGPSSINGTGEAGANTLLGNNAANVLDGKGGADLLTGGRGQDIFVFSTALGASNVDRITDFTASDDTIQLDDAVFTGLSLGALAASAFTRGTAAADALDRIIFDAQSGALFFDEDGAGGADQIRFATLGTGVALTHADFLVV